MKKHPEEPFKNKNSIKKKAEGSEGLFFLDMTGFSLLEEGKAWERNIFDTCNTNKNYV